MGKVGKKVVIVGAGGHGQVILDILIEAGIEAVGFLDTDKNKAKKNINGLKVFSSWQQLRIRHKAVVAVLGIGDNKVRERVFWEAEGLGLEIISVTHPKAVISSNVKIGRGVVIMPGAIVNTGVTLKDGVIVNTAATVDHNCHLGSFCNIGPGAHLGGNVRVGSLSYVGIGAVVI